MRRLLYIILLSFVAFGCDKQKNIPDDKLTLIMRDIMLSNAIYDSGQSDIIIDSTDIYTPIFRKYGYNPDDFMFTVENLSKRKSVRFTDIIQQAAKLIEDKSNHYKHMLAMIDSVDNKIARLLRDTVHADTLRHFTKRSNPKKPDISIPLKKGQYTVSYVYFIDTTDRNPYLQYAHFFTDSTEVKRGDTFRTYIKNNRRRNIIDFSYTDNEPRNLDIYLAYSTSKAENLQTDVIIDSLSIVYSPLKDAARDSMIKIVFKWHNSPIYPKAEAKNGHADGKQNPKNYLTLRPDTTRVGTRGDTIIRR